MTKNEFLFSLNGSLRGLPQDEVEERLNFYSEMIEDRIEEGLGEEEAVAAVGTPAEVAEQIVADIPLSKIAKEKIKQNRKLRVWEIVLLAAGSPIWVVLLIAAFSVVLSLYASLWSIVISLWAVFGSLVGCALGGIAAGGVFIVGGGALSGIAIIGAAIVCAGLSIFTFFGCEAATKGTILLAKNIILGIKKLFIKREDI